MRLILNFCLSCSANVKIEYLHTDILSKGYYCEHFKNDSYGVAGDVYSLYLIDSINFKKLVCNYYDNDIFKYEINDNIIKISKFDDGYKINTKEIQRILIDTFVFDSEKLKVLKTLNY